MRKRFTKQGFFQRTVSVLLALALVAIPAVAAAASFDDLAGRQGQLGAPQIADAFGIDTTEGNIGETECKLDPSNPGTVTEKNAKNLAVEIDGVRFAFDHVYQHDRKEAGDSYDFIFTPLQDGKRLREPAFVYRSSTGDSGPEIHADASNALIIGVDAAGVPITTDGFEMDDNLVAGRCAGFNDSAFAKSLDATAQDLGDGDTESKLAALNVANRPKLSSTTTAFDSNDNTDPFTMAVQKITEVLASFSSSLVSALSDVMNLGNITQVKGLTVAWSTVRDLINLLFLVVLAALAVLTIIRVDVKSYDVRKSLPLLVFAVIGVNFALLFASIMVNTAFIISQPFMDQAQALVQTVATNNPTGGDTGADFGTSVVLLFASLIMLIGLAILLFFFIIRIIVVWLLAALSPVIFLFMILPLTRGESQNLLKHWIKWVYMAPIAFLILFIGSAMLLPAFGGHQASSDSGASALLSAIFYAGVLGAAVLIPYGLGGQVMRMAGSQATSLAGRGAKGGLRATDMLPLGRGMSVGEARRTGKAFLKARQSAQEDRASERGVALAERLYSAAGGAALARSATGLDDTRAKQYLTQAVDREQKAQLMSGLGADGALRIVQYQTATDPAAKAKVWGGMSEEERALSGDRVSELAAWKTVVQNNFAEPEHLARYAREGLHRDSNDPFIAAVKTNYKGGAIKAGNIDEDTLQYGLQYANAEAVGKMPGGFWTRAVSPGFANQNPEASTMLRKQMHDSLDPGAIQKAMDNTDRARAARAKRISMGKAYRVMRPDVQNAMRQANLNSFTDAEQHVGLANRSKDELAAEYRALKPKKGDLPPPI